MLQLLAAADILGVTHIARLGGAQAIAALAYGTQSVARVGKIFGPGNRFVTAAKQLVSSDCAIDFPAGPTEAIVLASGRKRTMDRGRSTGTSGTCAGCRKFSGHHFARILRIRTQRESRGATSGIAEDNPRTVSARRCRRDSVGAFDEGSLRRLSTVSRRNI